MEPGELISGKYRLLRQLGKGGMGSVWAARNELTDRDFAVKFLLPDLATNKEALSRFFLEARACGQIKHPAVVEVYDMGQADDSSPYLVMELLEGEGFDHRLHREGVFAPADAAKWLAFVARGLAEAHERGLVHRDLKPGNVFFMIDARGEMVPKLLDFGVSKAVGVRAGDDFVKTTTGAVLGSPAYMSPEQAKGETDIDGRSDVWSLGVILYESLTGRIPFDAPNYNALMLSIITKEHDQVSTLMPGVPAMLSEVVDLALMKDRSKRIQTATALAERLEAVAAAMTGGILAGVMDPQLRASPNSIPPPRQFSTTQGTWSGRRTGGGKRSPIVYGATTLVLGALVLGGIAAFLRTRGPVVAVAGRSELALTTGLTRLKVELEHAQAEAQSKAQAQAGEPTARPKPEATTQPAKTHAIDAASLPAAAPAGPRGGGAPVRKTKKPGGKDPHGGVDSAGF